MKTNTIILLVLVCFSSTAFGQEDENLKEYYKKLLKRNQINAVPAKYTELQNTFQYYEDDLDALDTTPKYYNNALLNVYFKNIVTSFASNISDLTFNSYFLNTSTDKKNITFGTSFRLENVTEYIFSKKKTKLLKDIRPIQKLGNIFTVYLQADVASNFAEIFDKDDDANNFNDNINLGFKYTYIFNGGLTATNSQKVEGVRSAIVKAEIQALIDLYTSEKHKTALDIENIGITDDEELVENEEAIIRKKFFEFYKAIIDSELKYAERKNLISSSTVYWFDIEALFPLTKSKANYLSGLNALTQDFENYKFSVSGTLLYSNTFGSFKVSPKLALFHTNNFIANSESLVSLQEVLIPAPGQILVGDTSKFYNTTYYEFWAQSAGAELSALFFNNTFGLSISGDVVNYNGNYAKNVNNWKLGIPFSLKDKEGKPTVNFELQWKEVNKNHVVGIGLGYNFGKFIK